MMTFDISLPKALHVEGMLICSADCNHTVRKAVETPEQFRYNSDVKLVAITISIFHLEVLKDNNRR